MQDKNYCTLKSFKTLEELLIKELSFSKSLIKKHLPKRKLQYFVKERDELLLPLEILNIGYINPIYNGEDIVILKEDENFIAVNKPFGVHGHPHSYSEKSTVLNFLRSKYSLSLFSHKFTEPESNLLYRLDKDTSGVLIFAKNNEAHKKVRDTFLESVKKKSYLAVVKGKFNKEGTHEHYLESFGEKGSKMRVKESGRSKVHIDVSLINYSSESDLSLVKIDLGQGVRHQIRCQLSSIGFPILGDTLYGGEESERLYLHAYRYEVKVGELNFEVESREDRLFLSLFDLNSCL